MSFRALFYLEQNYSYAVLRPLQKEIVASGGSVRWFLVGDEVDPTYLHDQELRLSSVQEVKAWQPEAVFVPGDRVPSFIPGLKVEVFHGLNESKRGNEYPERGMFDLYCTEGHGRTSTLQALAKKRGYFKVVETGWVKLDSLFNSEHATVENSGLNKKEGRPQIIFSSTFTPSLSCAELVYEEIKRLSANSQWQWLVTLHPKMDKQLVSKYRQLENENLRYFESDSVVELLHRADLMICDNSSILQEFLLLKKPVVTVNNRDPLPCFINIAQPEQLAAAILQGLLPEKELRSHIDAYGLSVTPYLDGQSASRVMSAVKDMLAQKWLEKIKHKKPLNIFRNLKIRQQIGYWKWW